MKHKYAYLIFIFFITLSGFSQDWKTYPYNPTGQVAFPIDEGRHTTEPIEWWYATAQVVGQTTGTEYSVMLTYFYYPQSIFDGFRILNITNHDTGIFYQDVKPLNYTTLSTTNLNIVASVFSGGIESWTNTLDTGNNIIPFEYDLNASASFGSIDFNYETVKRPLILGDDGYLEQGQSNYTYYYSQTQNDVLGTLTLNGSTESIIGTGWIDRQYGNFNPLTGEKYEWFSMQLSNGMDINLWNIFTVNRTIPNDPKYRILSAYVDETTQYTSSDFNIERLQYNCMSDNLMCYSKQWRLTSSVNNLDLTISVREDDSEVQLPFRFFEGSTLITGTVNGTPVTGIGFAELLHGYEHPEVIITSPSGGFYDTSEPISWTLTNPDEGRPVFYDLEYSIDNQVSFQPIVQGLTESMYLWDTPSLSNGDQVWFKVLAYSIDGVLNSTIISDASSTTTLGLNSLSQEGISIYPNPVNDKLNIVLKNNQFINSFQLLDISGRLVFDSKYIGKRETQLSTNFLNSGIYFVKVNVDINSFVLKFIKK